MPPPIHREHIKATIRVRYGSLEAFEQLKKLPRHSVNDVLRGRAVRRTADAIARELDTTASELWPAKYRDADESSDMLDDIAPKPRRRRLSKRAA